MLNQSELNFYGFNPKNIIRRAARGRVYVVARYDAENKFFVITRRTPRTTLEDRTRSFEEALSLFYKFLYKTKKQLVYNFVTYGKY